MSYCLGCAICDTPLWSVIYNITMLTGISLPSTLRGFSDQSNELYAKQLENSKLGRKLTLSDLSFIQYHREKITPQKMPFSRSCAIAPVIT